MLGRHNVTWSAFQGQCLKLQNTILFFVHFKLKNNLVCVCVCVQVTWIVLHLFLFLCLLLVFVTVKLLNLMMEPEAKKRGGKLYNCATAFSTCLRPALILWFLHLSYTLSVNCVIFYIFLNFSVLLLLMNGEHLHWKNIFSSFLFRILFFHHFVVNYSCISIRKKEMGMNVKTNILLFVPNGGTQCIT